MFHMRLRAALVAVPLIVLPMLAAAACSSSSSSSSTSGSSGTETASSSEAATLGPSVPAATALAAPVDASLLATASGAFGEKPTLTFPSTPAVPSLQRTILSEGTGPLTASGDWLITNYLGQIWNGKVFDNSYDRGYTSAFQIGAGKVVPGWDVGLVGVPVGSRVLLSLPPPDGYGSAGSSGAGIGGTDTIVFVVDIVQAIGPTAGGQTDATPQPAPATGPQVVGALGVAPTITVPAGTAEPTAPTVTVLATGTGAPITNGSVLSQYVAVTWTGESAGSTWPSGATDGSSGQGPQELPVAAGGPFANLVGVPLGSRVLVQVPAQTDSSSGQSSPSIAAVVDVIAQTAKS
jgi:peptidylprolyl isomerase